MKALLAMLLAVTGAMGAVTKVREFDLHKPRDKRMLFAMAITPSQDVLSFIAGEDGKWRLSRVRNWLDAEPKEESIIVPGLAIDQPPAGSADLLLSPDGRFVLCWTHAFPPGPAGRSEDSFTSLVDLDQFKIASSVRRPLAPASFTIYHFNADGFVAAKTVAGSHIELVVLSVPDLAVEQRCEYSESKSDASAARHEGNESCASLLRSHGASSLSKFLDESDGPTWPRPILSADGRFKMWISQTQLRILGVQTPIYAKPVEEIFSTKSGKLVGTVRDSRDLSTKSEFATSNGREFLLVMEGGTRLIVYEITD